MRVLLAALILALVDQSLGAINAEACSNCTYSSGLGYIGNPNNCNQFFQCVKRADGSVDATLLCCVEGTFWQQDHFGCVRGYCIDPRDECPDIPSTTDFPCPLEAVPGDDSKFIDLHTYEVLECGAETVYSAEDCACVAGGNKTCDDDPLLWFPFARDFNDIQCHKVKGTGHGDATLIEEEGYLDCDGDGDLVSFGFLNNYFAWKKVDEFTISIWFNQSQTGFEDNIYEGVFGNGDCNENPSIWLGGNATFLVGGASTDQGSAEFKDDEGEDLDLRFYIQGDYWCQFGLRLSNNTLTMFLNGIMVGERSLSGYLSNTQTLSTIGMAYKDCIPHFWNGALDDFMYFDRFVSKEEMKYFVFGRGRTFGGVEGPYTSTFFPERN